MNSALTLMVKREECVLRQWVLAGGGIASKSWWDVKRGVEQGRLKVLFADRFIGFSRHDKKQVGLQFVCKRPARTVLTGGGLFSRQCDAGSASCS
jgi:hypothetical protein